MGFLENKHALIVGVASDRSIATGIAKAMAREGAELAFTYQMERFKDRVVKVAEECGSSEDMCFECDLGADDNIEKMFTDLGKKWDGLDIIIHSAAYAPADQLDGDYVDVVSREGFKVAHEISSYSFAALARGGRKMMQGRNGALLTMTHLGANRTFANYNVMGVAKASLEANTRYMAASLGKDGIRVNAISAGSIRTLAASGIKNFRKMLAYDEKVTPLHRCVTTEQVGNTAAFLCSDLASGITGQIVYVDSGFHMVGIADGTLE